jgi:hypothetical protein
LYQLSQLSGSITLCVVSFPFCCRHCRLALIFVSFCLLYCDRYFADWWNVVSWLNYILFAFNLSQGMAVSSKVSEP